MSGLKIVRAEETNLDTGPMKLLGPGVSAVLVFGGSGSWKKGAAEGCTPAIKLVVSSQIIFGNQTISENPRFTALRPYLATGLPLSPQSLTS